MSKADYYKVLGVEKTASADELKKAYRSMAMKYHPDRNPNDKTAEQKFKEINEAYDVLKDEQKKAAYDRFGHAAFENMGGGSRGGHEYSNADFSDIFGDLFGDFMGANRGSGGGSAGGNAQRARGADLRYNLQISLEDAFGGKQQPIKFSTSAHCEKCNSTGSSGGSEPANCGTCRGTGRVRAQQGFFTIERTCSSCHGMGKIIKDPCRSCHGEGRVRKEKNLSVTIPAGVEEGTRIRLAGEGEAGVRGAPAGDLYIFITISQHQFFNLEGSNVHCRVPIKMTTASLGGSIEVPTIDGSRAKVTIPAGTQTSDKFRLKAKGMSIMRSSSRGDMFIHVTVETPVNLNKRQKEILKEFDEIAENNSNPQSESFFKKVKDFWGEL
jgi:molecular chaperone DnaJ